MTPHFTLKELTHSDTANTHGIDNAPTDAHKLNLAKLASLLEQVRKILGNRPIRITSGYRGAALNARVGGSKTSAHLLGLAADFQCPSFGETAEIVAALQSSDLHFDQLIEEHSGSTSWVHIGLSEKPWRREVLLYRDGHYSKWEAGKYV